MIIDSYEIINTGDGSHTIQIVNRNITFHSTRGAIQESQQVFIDAGFKFFIEKNPAVKNIRIFEMGLGTGLNALLTAIEAQRLQKNIEYHTIDLHPLPFNLFRNLNYAAITGEPELFHNISQCAWNVLKTISPFLKLKKTVAALSDYVFDQKFDIIYFDAFAPNDQPGLWTEETFKKISEAMNENGVLVTYCSKSVVRKALESAGLTVEKIPGPPGKREVIRALKL